MVMSNVQVFGLRYNTKGLEASWCQHKLSSQFKQKGACFFWFGAKKKTSLSLLVKMNCRKKDFYKILTQVA